MTEAQRPTLVRAAVADAVKVSPTRNTTIERPPTSTIRRSPEGKLRRGATTTLIPTHSTQAYAR
jgi:hypothetical protein